jgi:hypothetical protein
MALAFYPKVWNTTPECPVQKAVARPYTSPVERSYNSQEVPFATIQKILMGFYDSNEYGRHSKA